MLYPLKFEPLYKDHIWGGSNLVKYNKKDLYPVTAESWEISANKDGMGIIANGELAGKSLAYVFDNYKQQLCGDVNTKEFPLLIKFIDANAALSVQVHPDDEYADKYEGGSLGKTEMWYVLDAKPQAQLVYGLKANITKEQFQKAVDENNIDSTLNYIDVKKGDWMFIPAGLVHAIGAGIVILEIQQNSNTTYRVYDYDRVGNDGKKRDLHVQKAMDVISFEKENQPINTCVEADGVSYLAYNEFFAVSMVNAEGSYTDNTLSKSFHAYTVIEGAFEIDGVSVSLGESVLIPACMEEYTLEGSFSAVKSFVP